MRCRVSTTTDRVSVLGGDIFFRELCDTRNDKRDFTFFTQLKLYYEAF